MDRISDLLDESTNQLDDPSNVSLDDPSNEQTNHEEAQINLLNNLIRRDDYPKRDAAYHDRLSTFQDFPQNCPVEPEQLALAGFRYSGQASGTDMVRCDYCSGRLQRWEETDEPLQEHARHYPDCPFLHPLTQEHKNPQWSSYETRLSSFDTEYWAARRDSSMPQPEALARAGFHFVGGLEIGRNQLPDASQQRPTYREDATKCFHCDTTLHSWEEDDDVWQEHAKWSQRCGFLIAERGLEFVREHALDRLGHSTDHALGDWHGYFRSQTDARKEIPTDPRTIKAQITTADLKRQSEKLPEITRNGDVDSQTLDDLIKTIQCKVCLNARSSILFLPCSHISVCPECARQLTENKCPICRKEILHRLDAFIS